jgi:hypothetical protein
MASLARKETEESIKSLSGTGKYRHLSICGTSTRVLVAEYMRAF